MIQIILDYKPFPKQSFRFTKDGKRYQPKGKKQNDLMYLIKDQYKGDKLTGPIGIFIQFHYAYKASEKKYNIGRLIFKDTTPDGPDNLTKAVLDAIKTIVMHDDGQIAFWGGYKAWTGEDKIIITVLTNWKEYCIFVRDLNEYRKKKNYSIDGLTLTGYSID